MYHQWKFAQHEASKSKWAGPCLVALCTGSLLGLCSRLVDTDTMIILCIVSLIAIGAGFAVLKYEQNEKLTAQTLDRMASYHWHPKAAALLKEHVCAQQTMRVGHLVRLLRTSWYERDQITAAKNAERKMVSQQQAAAHLHARLCAPVDCPAKS